MFVPPPSHLVQWLLTGTLLLPPLFPPRPDHLWFPPVTQVHFLMLLALCKGGLQTWGWPEALLTNLGGHKAIFMQPDLPLLPSLPRPRIVSDHVLEETPPCNWMLWAKKRGSSAEGIYMRPSSQPRGSTTGRVLKVEAAVHQCLLQGHMGLGIPQWGSVLPPPNTQTFYTIYMYMYPCPCMCIYPSVHRNA